MNGFQKFEAGTPPIAEVIGLSASLDFINKLVLIKFMNMKKLTQNLYDKLIKNNDIKFMEILVIKLLLSFNIDGIHFNDLAMLLDKKNIAIGQDIIVHNHS